MPTTPTEIAPGYQPIATPSPGVARCVDPAGRRWVLREVPPDCLHGGGLHPAIRERLARVREVPHARVATLAGVVRGTNGVAYAVWADVDGLPIDRADVSVERLPTVARELASAVELLHARGLVHGGLTADAVLVTPAGDVWLTDVSPYLWDDPAVDVRAVADLLAALPAAASLTPPRVDDLPASVALRDLGTRWPTPTPAAPPAGGRFRRRAAVAAAAVAAAAVAVAWVIHGRTSRPADHDRVLPLVDQAR